MENQRNQGKLKKIAQRMRQSIFGNSWLCQKTQLKQQQQQQEKQTNKNEQKNTTSIYYKK